MTNFEISFLSDVQSSVGDASPVAFIEPTNWTLDRFRKRKPVQTFAEVVAGRVELTVRRALGEVWPLSPKRVVRFGHGGAIGHRELDAFGVMPGRVFLGEVKLSDRHSYALEGLEQLASIAEILRANGYTGQIIQRLVVVSDRASSIAGIATETSLGNEDVEVGVVRIPTAMLAGMATEYGIELPNCWNDASTRWASMQPGLPVRRTPSRYGVGRQMATAGAY